MLTKQKYSIVRIPVPGVEPTVFQETIFRIELDCLVDTVEDMLLLGEKEAALVLGTEILAHYKLLKDK